MNREIATSNFETALERFDFNRVAVCMKALNWTWLGQSQPPSLKNMLYTVRHLFEADLVSIEEDGREHNWSTGGFRVSVTLDNRVTIEFIVEDIDVPF